MKETQLHILKGEILNHVTESIFSVDGDWKPTPTMDTAHLVGLHDYSTFSMVDKAHAFLGVRGARKAWDAAEQTHQQLWHSVQTFWEGAASRVALWSAADQHGISDQTKMRTLYLPLTAFSHGNIQDVDLCFWKHLWFWSKRRITANQLRTGGRLSHLRKLALSPQDQIFHHCWGWSDEAEHLSGRPEELHIHAQHKGSLPMQYLPSWRTSVSQPPFSTWTSRKRNQATYKSMLIHDNRLATSGNNQRHHCRFSLRLGSGWQRLSICLHPRNVTGWFVADYSRCWVRFEALCRHIPDYIDRMVDGIWAASAVMKAGTSFHLNYHYHGTLYPKTFTKRKDHHPFWRHPAGLERTNH